MIIKKMDSKIFILIVFALLFGGVNSKPLPLEVFSKDNQYTGVKLSPDGKYFAASSPIKNSTALVIVERESMKAVYVYQFGEDQHVNEYYWANNERIIFTRNIKKPWNEQPVTYGQVYAGNYDGTKASIIFGYQGGNAQAGSRLNKKSGAEFSHAEILHMLPNDPKHIIIAARSMGNSYDSPVRIIKLNIYNSKKKLITRTPLGNMRVLLDFNGKPVITHGVDRKGNTKQFLYKERDWKKIQEKSQLNKYRPVSVNKSGNKLYMLSSLENETESLFEYDFNSNKITKLYQNPNVDISSLIRRPEDQTVIGIETMPGKFQYDYIDDDDEYAKLHKKLASAFPGEDITVTSRTKNLKEMVVLVQSDKNAGDFFLFNNEKNTAKYLMSKKSWVNPKQMVAKNPIHFESRDGKTIYGYLTLPKDKENASLITYVHGGPYGVRDKWWYDSTVQMLANNGYAVLQVNYRGSGGYGLEYESSAYKKRSTLIQQDIIDGTRWAMSQPEIQENNACIMGWSFGGYSALMSPLIEPELFKCSIAAAGVYDAVEQEDDADYSRVSSVAAQAAEIYGDDEVLLKKESPLTYIDKLKIPVFIVHGGKDERVTPEQSYLLKEALEKRDMPFEWMFKEKEGHGFYNPENRVEFYEKTLNFLNKHLN